MSVRDIVMMMGGASSTPTYIEDVFSTWLYTGNSTGQAIDNGIDILNKGALVWIKDRTNANNNALFNMPGGGGGFSTIAYQSSNSTSNSIVTSPTTILGDAVSGFSLNGSDAALNASSDKYASWTFRKQPKFFDVVTWTGDGVPGRSIPHSLGSVPGCIIIKTSNTIGPWYTYHTSLGVDSLLYLNLSNATSTVTGFWGSPTSTSIVLGNNAGYCNANGTTYVAYIFAHNAGGFGLTGTDNVISCGSYTGTGAAGTTVTLGYEPQFVLVKRASGGTADWVMLDTLRGFSNNQNTGAVRQLLANTSGAESNGTGTGPWLYPNATGFTVDSTSFQYNASGSTYIYVAIRRGPMKVQTDPTKVFAPSARAGNGSVATSTALGGVTDLTIIKQRGGTNNWAWTDRLRSATYELSSATTTAETQFPNDVTAFDSMTGFSMNSGSNVNAIGSNYIDYLFARAPSFFDEVCFKSTASTNQRVAHNLAAPPELIITKHRGSASNWFVYVSGFTVDKYFELNTTSAVISGASWGSSLPTSTDFGVNGGGMLGSGFEMVAYLFASCPGVSKVGSYIGTGAAQTINCGFTGGARFVLIKRTDSAGNWYVWDTARGITSGNDPYLLLNTTAAEVTTTDYISPQSVGFGLTATAPAALNASGGTYIYLAIA